ncbi:hypothetical protein [Oligoflexus tunisiensis]|uniref:hypothetical protein n=1 Tax=Oligoflexus tunisiensis TaxID=708132 RepID=UPI00114C9C06|nr:hypothetical protein [Oligoflexus tunisiensis]
MRLPAWPKSGFLIICMTFMACGADEDKPSLLERFEAVYAFTDCEEVYIGTALAQPIWMISYQTYYGGYLDQKETTFLDAKCKKSYTSLNRWATYRILDSSNEDTGEIHLEMKTRRILAGTADFTPSDMPGIPDVSCNIEMADDLKKEECKIYFSKETSLVSRYVSAYLTAEGLRPFKNIDSGGTTEETRNPELAPYVLSVLDAIAQ